MVYIEKKIPRFSQKTGDICKNKPVCLFYQLTLVPEYKLIFK